MVTALIGVDGFRAMYDVTTPDAVTFMRIVMALAAAFLLFVMTDRSNATRE